MPSRRRFVCLSAVGLAALAGRVHAQPAGKPVRIIVPLPAGGSTDALARLIADKLKARYAPAIVVDNRAGAGGRIGVEAARYADADGSVLLFTPDFPFTLFPSIYKRLPYAIDDFTPVVRCGVTAMALAAGPGLPEWVRTPADFIQWAKGNPKSAMYGSPAAGSTPHFAGMMLGRAAGVDLTHVAYKGGAPAILDLVGGQIPVSVNPVGEVLQFLKAGKLRVLATTGARRSAFLPEVPTLVESGYKDLVAEAWQGIFAPAGTPGEAANRLNRAVTAVIQEPEVVDAFAKIGFESATPAPPAAFAQLVKADAARWAVVVKSTGFTAED